VRVVVGRIGKAHGIRGEVTVEVRTDEPEERFAPGASLFIGDSDDELLIESSRPHGGGMLIGFAGVLDRTAAEGLRGIILTIERVAGVQPSGEDEYYDDDLIGCEVRDRAGTCLGVVAEVVHLPGQDLLSIAPIPDPTSVESTSPRPAWLLPLIRQFVPDIDIAGRVVTVDPPDGITDLAETNGSS
jgi:16S rRNA processing protein RimM